MKIFYIALLCLISIAGKSQDDLKSHFIMTWDSRNKGFGDSTQILVPLRGEYAVKWHEVENLENKGVIENCTDNIIIKFPKPGRYKLVVSGTLSTMNFAEYTIDSIPQPKYGDKDYKFISVDQWGGTIWQSFESFFYNCKSIEIKATDTPNLTQVTSFKRAFSHAGNFNSTLENWDMSNVKDMSFMFFWASSFNQPLNAWDVSSLENTHSMFADADKFNQPLDSWNVSKVNSMYAMFWSANNFNQNIESWDVSNVASMYAMFQDAYSFNQPLEKWNVSNVKDMNCMFLGAEAFNQPLGKWDVSQVAGEGFKQMFNKATSFNQPLNEWNVSQPTDISFMFNGAKSFDQPLDKWRINKDCIISVQSSSGGLKGVFTGTDMSDKNLQLTLNAWERTDLIDAFKESTQKP
ncbi:MAG: BspA family leucine-rich repeat surface protein [Bacteroidota bacterium]